MEAVVALRLLTIHILAALLLVLPSFPVAERPWPLTVQAARRSTDAHAEGPSIHPREYYLGKYGTRCIRNLTELVASEDAAEHLACFSGRGVRVALLDTGLCAGITKHSRNSVTCTSVVPGVACEDAGCAHGTRSVSVLAGQLSVSTPPSREPLEETAWRNREAHHAFADHYIGLAPDSTVRVLRIFDRQGRTNQRHLARALDLLLREAEDGEAGRLHSTWNTSSARIRRRDETVDVISLSYGSSDYHSSPQVQDRLYRLMHEHGVIVVAAAGNDGVRFGSVRSPADMPGVLAVGALRIEGHGRSAQTTQASRTLGNLESSLAAGGGHKSVAHFSGRGPTTWELPFGAGRAKPDLVALGQHVWAVQGVSAATLSAAARRARSASPALQLRSASGTSIAAPLVAGVVALCLEAAWSSTSAAASAPNITGGGSFADVRQSRLARASNSLRVREAILRTAVPLEEAAASLPPWPHAALTTPLHSNSSSTASEEHPRRVLAGVPLLKLYAGYLRLSRVSILSQGAGEVRPLRALHAIVAKAPASSAIDAPEALRNCASFAIPPSVRIGYGIPRDSSSDDMRTSQSCQPPHDPDGKAHGDSPFPGLPGMSLAAPPAAYWWPLSDQAVYPGATPVLLNISLHLCPPSSSAPAHQGARDAATAASGEAARRGSTTHTHVTYVITKVSGRARAREGHPSRNSAHQSDACPLLLFEDAEDRRRVRSTSPTRLLNLTARSASPHASCTDGEVAGEAAAVLGPRHTQAGVCSFVKRRSTQQRWMRHLLRVATELTVVASRSPTRANVGAQLSPPPTSFSLSVAVSSPASAHAHLCYDVARETVAMWRKKGERSPASEKGAAAGRSSAEGNDGHDEQHTREGPQVPAGHGRCVPLFHLFRALSVEGALHIFTGGSSSQPALAVPFAVRIVEPPPRVQRVLMDTSLDWFNPTTATSNLFIAGDDPHESDTDGVGAALRRGRQGQRHERAYAEAGGGDHPYTNLALLFLYLRHTLGMAVATFPLLHMSTITTLIEANGSSPLWPPAERTHNVSHTAQGAPEDALAHVGTLIIVDPERPLARRMRRLLTHAVLGGGADRSADGLNVLLVTDWYSADMAAQLHWTRDENLADAERSSRVGGTDAVEEVAGVDGDRDAVRDLRALRHLGNGSTCGLAGSSHVPSWNRWLSEVTIASGSATNNSDCNGAAPLGSVGLVDGTSELPFELSESIVIDGVLVVDAAAPTGRSEPEGNASATHGGGRTATSEKVVALRSLGQLNAAGVLQWRLPAQVAVQRQAGRAAAVGACKRVREPNAHSSGNGTCRTAYASNTSTVPSTQEGEAVLCNVMPSWVQQQRRLVKRTIVGTRGGSAPVSARSGSAAVGVAAAAVEDVWEEVPVTNGGSRLVHIGGQEAVEVSTRASAETRASEAAQSLTHGVLGFLTLPPPSPDVVTASANRFRPGRIAIFTDSDCLSTSDQHAQAALDELEALLYPPSASPSLPVPTCATWDCFAGTPDGQRLLQSESAQSSVCVEVVKELLLWLHTGNLHRWRDSAQLQCEARAWARAPPHRCTADATPGADSVLEPKAGVDSVDGDLETTNLDEVLGTAPERAHVGEVVWRLWASLAESTERDEASYLVEGPEDGARVQRDYAARQEGAAAKVMRALQVNYHGDWRAHLQDRNASPSSTGAAGDPYSHPLRPASGRRSGIATLQPPAQHTSLIESLLPLCGMLNVLRWLQHPLVLGQIMVSAAVVMSVWLCRARGWSLERPTRVTALSRVR
ncbi:serine peptidase, clan SB, family S8-like protein [Leishmania mexicana MHOM/GT/2001/U1103]|uniref:Subtilisin-like serine peptidase n=1 Tax=Leishmania mexicana (strain MHOM/GT/2001/U1103) TaxID=929439 RepID=E9APC8_LEIMU|nr:serine peptidase, clan SB, family S8-like protein [Leishmania mexicana MHOM/GT/2001/U1103]CBZ24792.1 serine peptidase, clan SB, family S8-like protein [Leishmania mexicana MHOM/GT/2001/U1103]